MADLIFAAKDRTDDSMEVSRYRDGSVCITLDAPWYGDTETGFGASLSFQLTTEQVQELVQWLTAQRLTSS